jgi:hypothetical protein
MPLPDDSLRALHEGIQALASAERLLLDRLTRHPADPDLLLALRDVRGLRERLGSEGDDAWRRGFAWASFTGQDLGVLAEWERECAAASPYRDDPAEPERSSRAEQFRALQEFLCWYDEHFQELIEAGQQEQPDIPAV